MLLQRAFKTKLKPNNEQATALQQNINAARFVYNWALEDRMRYYEWTGESLSVYAQKKHFNAIKHECYPWIVDADYRATESAFMNLDVAYKNFFRRIKKGKTGREAGFPKFKSRKHPRQSYNTRGSIHIKKDRIKLPKLDWIRLGERAYVPTDDSGWKLNFVTVSKYAGEWWISAQVEQEVDDPEPAQGDPLGVDWGLKELAICSDGTVFENPKPLQKAERKLRRLQKELSRRKKGGANWHKTKAKLAKQHARVANIRKHVLHNVSKAIIDKRPNPLVIESLNVKGMTQNHRLARAIVDASPGELMRQFEYKGEWYGVTVMKADQWYASTKTCHACGSKQEMTLTDRTFICKNCGVVIDRDLNAAKNLAALAN